MPVILNLVYPCKPICTLPAEKLMTMMMTAPIRITRKMPRLFTSHDTFASCQTFPVLMYLILKLPLSFQRFVAPFWSLSRLLSLVAST